MLRWDLAKRGLGLVLSLVMMLVSSCSSGASFPSPAYPGTVQVGDAQIVVPPNAFPVGVTVTGSRAPVDASTLPTAALDFVEPLSEALVVNSSAQPAAPLEVRFPVPLEASQTPDPLVVVWQDGRGGWRWMPTELTPERTVATATLDHFSQGFLARIRIADWAENASSAFGAYLTGSAHAKQPKCGETTGVAQGGFDIAAPKTDRILTCFGRQNGRWVLKVTNNRRSMLAIDYPKTWKVLNGTSFKLGTDALGRFIGTGEAKALAPKGHDARVIDGGDTLALEVPEGASGRVNAEMALAAWFASAIVFGLQVYYFGKDQAEGQAPLGDEAIHERALRSLVGEGMGQGWDRALGDCVGAYRNEVPTSTDATTAELLGGIFKAAFLKCVPSIAEAEARGTMTGLRAAVIGTLLAGVGLVLTAVHLLVTGARYVYDAIANVGAGDSVRVRRAGSGLVGSWWAHRGELGIRSDGTAIGSSRDSNFSVYAEVDVFRWKPIAETRIRMTVVESYLLRTTDDHRMTPQEISREQQLHSGEMDADVPFTPVLRQGYYEDVTLVRNGRATVNVYGSNGTFEWSYNLCGEGEDNTAGWCGA